MSIPETGKKIIPHGPGPRRIGIFAAAGSATRLKQHSANSRVSKEIIRVRNIRTLWHPAIQQLPLHEPGETDTPVGNYLIDSFLHADVDECIIVTRSEKTDLLNYYSANSLGNMRLQRLTVEPTPGTPWTIAHALQSVLTSEPPSLSLTPSPTFALGFPDIITAPQQVFKSLFTGLDKGSCDVMLGLFPVSTPHKYDMVRFDSSIAGQLQVTGIDIKPARTDLQWTWACAVWNADFSRYLIDFTESKASLSSDPNTSAEMYVGDILVSAMNNGFSIHCQCINQGVVLDIGTPDDLQLAQSPAIEKLFK